MVKYSYKHALRYPLMVLAAAKKHFVNGVSIGVICGKVSGNLECLDFDQPNLYKPFMETLTSINPGLAAGLVKWQTPSGGYHLIYRGEAPVSDSQKLAMSEDGKGTFSTEEVDLLHTMAGSFYRLIKMCN